MVTQQLFSKERKLAVEDRIRPKHLVHCCACMYETWHVDCILYGALYIRTLLSKQVSSPACYLCLVRGWGEGCASAADVLFSLGLSFNQYWSRVSWIHCQWILLAFFFLFSLFSLTNSRCEYCQYGLFYWNGQVNKNCIYMEKLEF